MGSSRPPHTRKARIDCNCCVTSRARSRSMIVLSRSCRSKAAVGCFSLAIQLYLVHMKLSFRNVVASLLLVYIVAGVLIEVGHHDVHDIALHAIPAVSTHGCGSKEIHVPLDKRHDCLACTQSAQRVATAATAIPATCVQFVWLGKLPLRIERTLQTDYLYSGKRGPPLLSL